MRYLNSELEEGLKWVSGEGAVAGEGAHKD
jgi:hypothetical protein